MHRLLHSPPQDSHHQPPQCSHGQQTQSIKQATNSLSQSSVRQSVAVPPTITSQIRKSGQNVPQIALMQGKARQGKSELLTPLQSPKAGHETNRYY